jgi:hypothetical protein
LFLLTFGLISILPEPWFFLTNGFRRGYLVFGGFF